MSKVRAYPRDVNFGASFKGRLLALTTTLHWAEKACQKRTFKLIGPIHKLQRK